jgi:hypothetical protein
MLAIAAAWAVLDIVSARVVESIIGSIAGPLWQSIANVLAH